MTDIQEHDPGQPVTLSAGWFYGALIGVLVLLALGLDLFFLTGFISSDDCQYSEAANLYVVHWKPPANPFIPNFSHQRLGVVLPAALFQWLSGENIVTQAYCFSLFHAGLIVVTFLLGRALHNRRAGAVAAAMVAVCPLHILYAGTVLPDTAQTMFMMGGLLALILARRRGFAGGIGFCLASGFLIGLSYTAKETSLVAMPVFGLALLWPGEGRAWPRRLAECFALGLGLAALIGIEMLILHKLYGSWILRPAMSSANVGYPPKEWTDFYKPIARYYWFADGMRVYMGRLYLLYMAAIPLYPFFRRRSWTVWALLVWIGGYMLWGTATLRDYIPQHVQPRYYMICVPLAALCLAAMAEGAAGWVFQRRWVAGSRLARAGAACVLIIAGGLIAFEGLRVSNENTGTLHTAWVSDEMGRAMDLALTSYNAPVLVCVQDLDPLFLGWPPTRRIKLKPQPVYSRAELASMLGRGPLLVLTRDDWRDTPDSFNWWAERRIKNMDKLKVDLAAEAQMATFGGSELFEAQRIGYFPPMAGQEGGRLSYFLRGLGWRVGNPRPVYTNAPKISLYLVRPNAATAGAAYQPRQIFSLAQALGDGGAEPWVGASAGVSVKRNAGALLATWQAEAPKDSWLSVTAGPLEQPPVSPSPQIEFPQIRNAGRQVIFRLRAQTNLPASLTLEVMQYDARGRVAPAGLRKELGLKTGKITEKMQEYTLQTLLEPETQSVRLRIGVEAPPNLVLLIEDLKVEQVAL